MMITGGCPFSRRRFLQAAGGAAGALAASALFPSLLRAAGEKTVDVGVSSAASPAERARGAVALVGGMKSFVSRGDVVVLKPNIGWDRTPEQAANTDPEFVVAVAEMCLAAGARSVRVFDRTCNDARRCYVTSGIKDAVERFARKNRVEDALRREFYVIEPFEHARAHLLLEMRRIEIGLRRAIKATPRTPRVDCLQAQEPGLRPGMQRSIACATASTWRSLPAIPATDSPTGASPGK